MNVERLIVTGLSLVAVVSVLTAIKSMKTEITSSTHKIQPIEVEYGKDALLRSTHFLKGNHSAKYILIEFFDYECPGCRMVSSAVDEFVDRRAPLLGYAGIHYPLPMHRKAVPAASLALSAEKRGCFSEIHKLLMSPSCNLDGPSLEQIASEHGISFDNETIVLNNKAISDDEATGILLRVNETPSFYIYSMGSKRVWKLGHYIQASSIIDARL